MGIRSLEAAKSASFGGHRLVEVAAVLLVLLSPGIEQLQTAAAAIDVSLGLCATLVRPWGYPCNEYTVQTADGYLLGVQNIPNGVSQLSSAAQRTPVFLQHGLFSGGDNWVFNDPSESLGFILADAGYDVWIGNSRGVVWSHGHIDLTTDDEDFWNWSWDEMAAYDLPAVLGFVYLQTGSKIVYIGHSQGTSVVLAGLVGTPQSEALADMFAGVVLVCPIAYMNNITSTFDRAAAELYLDKILYVFGVQEFNLHNELGVELVQDVCGSLGVNCTNLYRAVTGEDCCIDDTRLPFYLNFFPQATSSRNLGHFAQMIRRNTFEKYDYGFMGNVLHYMQKRPPVYDVAKFPESVPLMIVHGGHDSLADPTNVRYLVAQLGAKVRQLLFVQRYAHGDFLVSTTANVDVYPNIMSFIQNRSH